MATIAIDYTPAIRQQAGIGRIIRGQVAALIAAARSWICGCLSWGGWTRPSGSRHRCRCTRRPRRAQHGAALASVGYAAAARGVVHRRPARSSARHRFCACAEQGPAEAAHGPRPGLSLLSRRRHAQPAPLPECGGAAQRAPRRRPHRRQPPYGAGSATSSGRCRSNALQSSRAPSTTSTFGRYTTPSSWPRCGSAMGWGSAPTFWRSAGSNRARISCG